MLNFLGRRGSRAALIEAELENLSSWAQREWPLAWGDRFGMADLKEALEEALGVTAAQGGGGMMVMPGPLADAEPEEEQTTGTTLRRRKKR